MTRRLFALLLNIAAVLGPTAALYLRFGSDAKIDPENAAYILPLVAGMTVSFVVGTISARTLHSTAEGSLAVR